jgi:formate dehydrogenase assembly factor FdhD
MSTVEEELMMRRVRVTRIDRGGRAVGDDWVVREERFDLVLNGRQVVALVCLPSDLEAFVAGFLVNEGILDPHRIEIAVDSEAHRISARGSSPVTPWRISWPNAP